MSWPLKYPRWEHLFNEPLAPAKLGQSTFTGAVLLSGCNDFHLHAETEARRQLAQNPNLE